MVGESIKTVVDCLQATELKAADGTILAMFAIKGVTNRISCQASTMSQGDCVIDAQQVSIQSSSVDHRNPSPFWIEV